MVNLPMANNWKTLPVVQGVSLAFSNKPQMASFMSMLMGRAPSIREQISSHLGTQAEQNRSSPWQSL